MKYKTRRYHFYYWTKILFFIIYCLPLNVCYWIAELLGRSAYFLLPKYRNIALKNLQKVFGKTKEEFMPISKAVFVNLAKNGIEWIKLFFLNENGVRKLVCEVEGVENIEEAYSAGHGVVALAAHFGNWEILMAYIRVMGYSGAIIGKRIYFHKYDRLIRNLRRKMGDRVIYRDESPKVMLKILKEGNLLGILADQDIDSLPGIFVDFLGEMAYTSQAPVKFAAMSGAPILPVFIVRKKDNKHKIVFEKPIYVSREAKGGEELIKYTKIWSDIVGSYIKKAPEQWVWIHNRWKTKHA